MRTPDEITAGSTTAGTLEAQISIFQGVWGKKPTETMTMADYLRRVSAGDWKQPVEECRGLLAAGDEAAYRDGKKSLPAVCLSGTAKTRDSSVPLVDREFEHNGFLQGDLDEKDHKGISLKEIESRLRSIPEVAFYFRSPSGKGFKVGVRVRPDVECHEAAFVSASGRFAANGLKLDPSTKDPMRLCFVSYDPDVWIREGETKELEHDERCLRLSRESEIDCRYPKPSEDQVRDMLSFIPPRPEYTMWLKIIASVCDAVGEEAGLRLLKEWSPEEREGEYEEKIRHRLERVAAATLFFYAREHGWTGGCQPADVRFFPQRGEYFIRAAHCWRPYRSRLHVLNRLMKSQPDELSPKEKRRRAENLLQTIEERNVIDWAGPLAGHPAGPHSAGQHQLLVTIGPSLVPPEPGNCDTILAILEAVIGNDDHAGNKQVEYVLAWLKLGLTAIRSAVRTPGHVLIFAGVPESGKSLLVYLFKLVFGGRVGVPHQAWSRETTFNADLMGAELLVIDDCYNSGEMAKRRALATSMKESLFNDEVRIHPKGREAFCVQPVWRAVMCCNDDPDSLYVVPPLTSDVRDKFTILRTHRRPLPLLPSSPEKRREFQQRVQRELPAFIHHLDNLTIPSWLKANNRCGIEPFHHPYIKALLGDLNPEVQLLELIDYAMSFAEGGDAQKGSWDPVRLLPEQKRTIWTAAELLSHIGQPGHLPLHMCKGLPNSPQRMGRYLMSLAKSHPHRVREASMRNGYNRFEILPPPETQQPTE
ncbi:BT4734/BF3469 family protein [Luteolibacter soli]|uniref:BT4734/BF3469 family protein n=1 Tax=Luteolibacter soli TaxID=3135280 RepID=A0ABU9ARV5_9BACT